MYTSIIAFQINTLLFACVALGPAIIGFARGPSVCNIALGAIVQTYIPHLVLFVVFDSIIIAAVVAIGGILLGKDKRSTLNVDERASRSGYETIDDQASAVRIYMEEYNIKLFGSCLLRALNTYIVANILFGFICIAHIVITLVRISHTEAPSVLAGQMSSSDLENIFMISYIILCAMAVCRTVSVFAAVVIHDKIKRSIIDADG